MNILAFVISLLMILSYSFFITFEKQNGAHRIRSSFLGHSRANRKILESYENALFDTLKKKPLPKPAQTTSTASKNPKKETKKKAPLNHDCARFNLTVLMESEIEDHRLLFDLVAKLFSDFYGEELFQGKPKSEYKFLHSLIKIGKKIPDLPLEKYDFKDPELREIYYQMVKGSKTRYPSLLDYITLDPNKEAKICLFHAHPRLIAILFGEKAAGKIYQEMHKPDALPITQEVIERLCSEVHTPIYQPEIFNLLELGKPTHGSGPKKKLIGADLETAITLKKEAYVKIH